MVERKAFLVFLLICCIHDNSSLTENDLYNHIAQRVPNKWERPAPLGTPVHVSTHFYLRQIVAVDSTQQNIEFLGSLWAHWVDKRIHWDVKKFKTDTILYPLDRIWVPEFDISNAVGDTQFVRVDTDEDGKIDTLTVSHAGDCIIRSKFRVKVSCEMDVLNFPIDTQDCELELSPLDPAMHFIIHKVENVSVSEFFLTDEEWRLKDSKVFTSNASAKVHNILHQNWSKLHFRLYLQREPTYYYYNIVFPILYLGGLLVVAFVIPAESGEKMNLGITIMLSLTVFMLLLDALMPKVKTIPFLGQYISAVMALAMLTIITSAFILVFHHQNPKKKMPGVVYFLVFIILGTALTPSKLYNICKKKRQQFSVSSTSTDSNENNAGGGLHLHGTYNSKFANSSDKNLWIAGAHILDRFAFVFGILTIVIVTAMLLAILPYEYTRKNEQHMDLIHKAVLEK